MSGDEKRYTLREAKHVILRRECSLDGHKPYDFRRDVYGPTATPCSCGEVLWEPSFAPMPPLTADELLSGDLR